MEPHRVLRPPGAAEIPLAVTIDLATLEVRRRRVFGRLINEHEQAAFTSTEVVYGVTGTGVTELPEYGVSP